MDRFNRASSYPNLPNKRSVIRQWGEYKPELIRSQENRGVTYPNEVSQRNEGNLLTSRDLHSESNLSNWSMRNTKTSRNMDTSGEIEYLEDDSEIENRSIPIRPITNDADAPSWVENFESIMDELMFRNDPHRSVHNYEPRIRNYDPMKTLVIRSGPGIVRMYPFNPQLPESRNGPCKFCSIVLFIIVLSLFVGMVSIILQQGNNRHSNNFVDAVCELQRRLYGQEQAIEILSEHLLLNEPSFKVITLIGGTGVGKSYTVDIIKENFPREYFVTELYAPIHEEDAIFILYPQLIILENLREREEDLERTVKFLKTLKQETGDKYITVLAVFNFEQMDSNGTRILNLEADIQTLRDFFADEDIDPLIVPYYPLDESTLEKCVLDASNSSGLMLSKELVDLIKYYLQVNNAGCKGAYAKVQLLGR